MDLGSRELWEYEKEQQEISNKLEKAKQSRSGIARILKHPFRFIFEKPLHILILTVPIALIIFVFGTAYAIRDYGMSVL
ncbi:MAG TPA: type II secretion system F family protein, partial [Methanolinea sp.]|nr:type II secretion system F family protein [Methanolinea sp.]